MAERMSGQPEPFGKSGKRKATFKRSKAEGSRPESTDTAPERTSRNSKETAQERIRNGERDPEVFVRIQERAYGLFEASGFEHGHDLEHWFEAERQITGSFDRKLSWTGE